MSHPIARLLLNSGTISGHRDKLTLLLEVLREREVVLEAHGLDFLRLVAAVGVQVERKLQLLMHPLILYQALFTSAMLYYQSAASQTDLSELYISNI